MIPEEKLKSLYNVVIEKSNITTKDLYDCGFNRYDINTLIKIGAIERITRGNYKFLKLEDLYEYGKSIADINRRKSDKCFELCANSGFKLNSVLLRLLISAIKSKDFDNAFNRIDAIIAVNNGFINHNIKFCIYILSYITELPEKYNNLIDKLSINDMLIDVEKHSTYRRNNTLRNKIKAAAVNRNFMDATKYKKELDSVQEKEILTDTLINYLIRHYASVCNTNNCNIGKLISEKNYTGLVEYIDELRAKHGTTKDEDFIQKLATDIINIQETDTIPVSKILNADNIFVAIDNKNYALALSLKTRQKNHLNLLIKDICKLIMFVIETMPKEELSINEVYQYISICLIWKDPKSAFSLLRDYLKKINKEQYELVLVNLIKISLIENDDFLVKLLSALTKITNNCAIDISEYIKCFYVEIFNDNIIKAQLYFEIIKNLEKLGSGLHISSQLKELLPAPPSLENNIYRNISKESKMNIDDFDYNTNYFLGINNIEEINQYIKLSGLDLESAGLEFGLSYEEIDKLRLIYAREYYIRGFDEQGDRFMKAFEQSQYKTDFTKSVFQEIKTNKKLYNKRPQNSNLKLSLLLKPKK